MIRLQLMCISFLQLKKRIGGRGVSAEVEGDQAIPCSS